MKRVISAALFTALAGTWAARAEFIDHVAACRQWGQISLGVFARIKTQYDPSPARGASQEKGEEDQARAAGWNDENIRHLRIIVAEAKSGRWTTLEDFSKHTVDDCEAAWKSSSTAEQRATEATEVQRRTAQARDTANEGVVKAQRVTLCSQYMGVASQLIAIQHSGQSYQNAANWASAQAYGTAGQVFRYSQENADAFIALAAAVYFARDKYGSDDRLFVRRSFDDCVAGQLMDAGEPAQQ